MAGYGNLVGAGGQSVLIGQPHGASCTVILFVGESLVFVSVAAIAEFGNVFCIMSKSFRADWERYVPVTFSHT